MRGGATSLVGRFHVRPVSVAPGWAVTTNLGNVAEAVARLLGGASEGCETHDGEGSEVLTETCGVRVVLDDSAAISAHMTAVKAGQPPQPTTRVGFRLAESPGLGYFRLDSASWDFAEGVSRNLASLTEINGKALCELLLEMVEFTTRDGLSMSYRRPILKVVGTWRPEDSP